jgi:NAD(P)-dependent dehydrogenase (short-subunit alcohol dehydrogenase family)
MVESGRLRDKTALITGGGSGIGKAVTLRFVEEGCRVVIAGRTESKLRDAWEATGRSALLRYRACDVGVPEEVQQLVSWATEQLGQIDILVNNAGLNIKKRMVRELSVDSWQTLLRANLNGAFYCIHAVLPQMLKRRDGLIINVSSVAGKRANPLGGAAYAASKFGMSALSHCLGAEEKDSGIRCSVIYPGEVDTPILESRPSPVTPEQRARILQPEDVAEAVLFVATLPPRVSVPELIIKPTSQVFV